MPIYAYKCSACGFEKDVLQKMSDPLLTECPSCEKSTFSKQLTAAGFQLKGSGWYVTDFRNGSGASKTAATSDAAAKPAEAKPAETKSSEPASGTPAAPATAPPAASA